MFMMGLTQDRLGNK